jgi:hypothetical protein
MTLHYAPGPWRVIATPVGIVVLEQELAPELLTRIWEQVSAGRGFAAVLEALTGAFGTSLAAIPSFAVALAENDGVRLAVRGAFAVTVDTTAGAEEATGVGVTTWTERVIAGAGRVSVRSAATTAPVELPLRDGVVAAGALEWILDPAAVSLRSLSERSETKRPDASEIAGPEPIAQPEPDPEPEPEREPDAAPAARGPWSGFVAPPPAAPASPTPEPTPAPEAPAPLGGLIDSVPTITSADTLLPPDATLAPIGDTVAPAVAAASDDPLDATTGYDHLWGATVVRSVEEAAVRETDEDDDASASSAIDAGSAPATDLGDHDGATISVAQARALRGSTDPGHDSTPTPLAPPRSPAPGRIRLSTGQELLLDRTVVIGRRPRSTRVAGTDLPHLVAVDSPQQDISRSHLELRAEGDAILATDLHTTNGTTLLRPGADPVRLHPGEQTVVVAGDLLDLGDGIVVTIEEVS